MLQNLNDQSKGRKCGREIRQNLVCFPAAHRAEYHFKQFDITRGGMYQRTFTQQYYLMPLYLYSTTFQKECQL